MMQRIYFKKKGKINRIDFTIEDEEESFTLLTHIKKSVTQGRVPLVELHVTKGQGKKVQRLLNCISITIKKIK
jgi:hypothetical protein